jgi:hypothetical protein
MGTEPDPGGFIGLPGDRRPKPAPAEPDALISALGLASG